MKSLLLKSTKNFLLAIIFILFIIPDTNGQSCTPTSSTETGGRCDVVTDCGGPYTLANTCFENGSCSGSQDDVRRCTDTAIRCDGGDPTTTGIQEGTCVFRRDCDYCTCQESPCGSTSPAPTPSTTPVVTPTPSCNITKSFTCDDINNAVSINWNITGNNVDDGNVFIRMNKEPFSDWANTPDDFAWGTGRITLGTPNDSGNLRFDNLSSPTFEPGVDYQYSVQVGRYTGNDPVTGNPTFTAVCADPFDAFDPSDLSDILSCTGSCTYTAPEFPEIDFRSDPTGPLTVSNRMTRISPVANDLTLAWKFPDETIDVDSNFGVAGASCSEPEFIVEVVEKSNLNIGNNLGCDFTTAENISIDKTNRSITLSHNSLDSDLPGLNYNWNKAYCWRVSASNNGETSTSPIYTFRTNTKPINDRMGLNFVNSPNNFSTTYGRPINSGSAQCSISGGNSGSECNTLSTTDIGGDTCWIAGFDGTEDNSQKDHTLTLWFEYSDPDNESIRPNEGYMHKLAFLKKEDSLAIRSNLLDESTLEANPDKLFHVTFSDLTGSPQACLNDSRFSCETSNEILEIVDSGVNVFSGPPVGNRIRVYYKIRFLKNPNPNGNGLFEIFAMMKNRVDDPFTSGGWTGQLIADNYSASEAINIPNSSLYSRKGEIGIDNINPEVNIGNKTISGFNSFDIRWTGQDTEVNGSGINDFDAFCFANEIAPTLPFNLEQNSPTSRSISVEEYPDIGSIPSGYNQCISNSDKDLLIASPDLQITSSYTLADFENYNYLASGTQNTIDNACNKGPSSVNTFDLSTGWVTTRSGSVFSDGNINLNIPDGSEISESNNLYIYDEISRDVRELYRGTEQNMVFLSSDMLGSQNPIDININSLSGEKIESYFDLGNKPYFGVDGGNWYEYFKNLLIANKSNNITNISTTSSNTGNISTILSGCPFRLGGNTCIYEYDNPSNIDLIIENGICNIPSVIFSEENIIIQNEFKNLNENTGCIFISKKSITFSNTIQTYDKTISDRGIDITTSPYDVVEGYFISDKNSNPLINNTITIQNDSETISGQTYSDGLLVRGGLIAPNFEFQRNLGLRSNIQPAIIMMYDPRYILLFEDQFGYSSFKIREK